MITRLKALLADRGAPGAARGAGHGFDDLQLAAAALLVEAACMDEHFDARERETIERLVTARFGLTGEEARDLVAAAERVAGDSAQLLPFTRVVKDRFSPEERVELIEMLWEVAYADGILHHFEAHLLRRIAGLIYVSDKDRGAARKRVIARLGLAQETGPGRA